MKIGMVVPHWTGSIAGTTPTANEVIDLAQSAEEIGIESIWVTDHLYHEPAVDFRDHGYEPPAEMDGLRLGFWESWTLLAALAARTNNLEIGVLVANTAFRNPALLAKMATTVDSLSNGRLNLGLGAGDFRSEHVFHGYPWANRVSRFEEALQIIAPLLRGERTTFQGEYYEVSDVELVPEGPRDSGPPILIGTMMAGPRMQRLAIEYGDGWSCWLAFEDSRADNYNRRLQRMLDACDKRGRDPASLSHAVAVGVTAPDALGIAPGATPLSGSPDQVASDIQRYAELGTDHLAIYLQPCTPAGLEWFGEVLQHVRVGQYA